MNYSLHSLVVPAGDDEDAEVEHHGREDGRRRLERAQRRPPAAVRGQQHARGGHAARHLRSEVNNFEK